MVNLITLGSQHQGVYGLPRCLGDDVKLCDYIRTLLNHGAYKKSVARKIIQKRHFFPLIQVLIQFFRWIQRFVTPAEYWHDPLDETLYKKSSVFLADINNERVS